MISGLSSTSRMRQSSGLPRTQPTYPVDPVRKVAPRGPGIELPPQDTAEGASAALVSISDDARRALAFAESQAAVLPQRDSPSAKGSVVGSSTPLQGNQTSEAGSAGSTLGSGEAEENEGPGNELSSDEQTEVRKMSARDAEVRTHEQAHKAAGGQYAGAIHLDTERGPDGKSYAIGGHVNIDTGVVKGDPSATIAKMQQVVRAALAPANPSGADRSVASSANGKLSEARRELAIESSKPADASAAVESSPPSELGQGQPFAPASDHTRGVSSAVASAAPRARGGTAPFSLVA